MFDVLCSNRLRVREDRRVNEFSLLFDVVAVQLSKVLIVCTRIESTNVLFTIASGLL